MNIQMKISVGEPWDFTGPDGENIVMGSILRIVNEKCCIFKAANPVSIDGITSEILVLVPRYKNEFFNDFFKGGKSITINASLLKIVYSEEIDEQTLIMNSDFSIIGGLERCGHGQI
jgi:hypothetical protein